jgi:hypothetical protein
MKAITLDRKTQKMTLGTYLSFNGGARRGLFGSVKLMATCSW